jgi:hypothetical protein
MPLSRCPCARGLEALERGLGLLRARQQRRQLAVDDRVLRLELQNLPVPGDGILQPTLGARAIGLGDEFGT